VPTTPRGWAKWAYATIERLGAPRNINYDFVGLGRIDSRTNTSRELAVSVLCLLQASGNGNGSALLTFDFLTKDFSWWSLTPSEQRAVAICLRRFQCSLCTEHFLDPCGRPRRGCARGKG
jgi:hypothetical protein